MRDQGHGGGNLKNELKIRTNELQTFLIEMFVKSFEVQLEEPDSLVIAQFDEG